MVFMTTGKDSYTQTRTFDGISAEDDQRSVEFDDETNFQGPSMMSRENMVKFNASCTS